MGRDLKLRQEELERIAQLASLAIDQAALPALTAQIARIIEYVSQLEAAQLPAINPKDLWLSLGPRHPLRPDVARRSTLHRDLPGRAPAMREGFFTVPRLPAMED